VAGKLMNSGGQFGGMQITRVAQSWQQSWICSRTPFD